MTVVQLGLQTVGRYLDAVAEKPTERVLYRGHSDEKWDLTPSAFRQGTTGIDNLEKLRLWMRAAGRLASPVPRSEFEWVALAQHYGIATPLLDWTANPLTALFFACAGHPDATGCVWQVRTQSAFKQMDFPHTVSVFRSDRPKPGLVYAASMNARSSAQDSAMSIHRDVSDTIPAALMRVVFRVATDEKHRVIKALEHLGFSEERLFSDMTVVARRFVEDLVRHELFES